WPLAGRRVLGRAVQLRSPYVDALSLLQVRALRGLRAGAEGPVKDELQHLLLLTVNGVAAGLQNTGCARQDARDGGRRADPVPGCAAAVAVWTPVQLLNETSTIASGNGLPEAEGKVFARGLPASGISGVRWRRPITPAPVLARRRTRAGADRSVRHAGGAGLVGVGEGRAGRRAEIGRAHV